MKKSLMLTLTLLTGLFAFAQTPGEKVYKEVNVNGETVFKWLEVDYFTEYDRNGNEIHSKDNNGYEDWYEYDSNGNIIHSKDNKGYEKWYECDSNGNIIHSKDNKGGMIKR